jgi:DNA-binding NarL/FixJ family response regulator
VIEGLRKLLTTAGDIVVIGEAHDASGALEQARNLKPDVILLDLRMPAMDGEAFARAYRRLPNATAPIILTSALPGAEAHAARIGATGCLAKPFDLDDLLAAVHSAVSLRAVS